MTLRSRILTSLQNHKDMDHIEKYQLQGIFYSIRVDFVRAINATLGPLNVHHSKASLSVVEDL